MVALRGQRASSHPATSLLDLKRSPELNHVVWPPLPSTLSALPPRLDTGRPARGAGVPVASATGNRSSAQPDRTGRKGKGVPGRCGSLSLFSYSVYGAMCGAPRGRVRRDRTRPRPRDGPCRGRWTMPRLVRGPRTAVRSSLRAPQPCSLHCTTHRPLITPFRIRSEFAGRSHHAYFSDERHNNKEVLPP